MTSADPQPPAPPRLGRYQLLRRIAVGGMAEIYLARVTGAAGFAKNVVVKRILPQLAQSDEFYQMFLDEARIAATLQHPNVVQIYDAQNVGGEHFIAMEHLDGADLLTVRRVLAERRQGLPVQHSVFIVGAVASGLHYAHEKRGLDGHPLEIVHRDVTPQNVILTREGGVKLVDFGIAKATNRMTTTGFGTLKGKLAYMSPEQCRSEPVDRRSDVYSLGIILFELTTGKRLYRGMSEYEVLRQVIETDVPPPSSLLPGYPPDLEAVVLRALARDRNERYQTALAFHQDLERFARARGVVGSSLALAEFLAPLLAEAERQTEERLQRRLVPSPDDGGDGMPIAIDSNPSGRVDEPVQSRDGNHTVATPIRRAAASRPATEPSMIEVTPDLSRIRLRRSAFWPLFILALLAAGGAAAFYYLRVMRAEQAAPAADAGTGRRPPPAVGGVEVTSRPDGAAVWLRLGRAPLTSIPVDPGRPHLLRVEHDGYKVEDALVEPSSFAGGRQAELTVLLEPTDRAAPVEEPTAMPGGVATASPGALPAGRIRITSDPPAATVWLLVAITPGRAGPFATDAPLDLRLGKSGHLPAFATVSSDAFDSAGEAEVGRDLEPRAAP